MPLRAEGAEEFDLRRFRALLELAGPSTARELTSRLDEDLSQVATALAQAEKSADRQLLRSQSHVLLAISGTIGANGLYLLSERLNRLARSPEGGPFSEILRDIHVLLDRLIQFIRSTKAQMAGEP